MKLFLAPLYILLITLTVQGQPSIRVGSKHFNEGYILSEMIAQILENGGYNVERKFNLGGTVISFEALRTGAVDVYPEYTGTISSEILKLNNPANIQELNQLMKDRFGLEISSPYGFNNTYALVIKRKLSEELNLEKISDLLDLPDLKIGISYEFLERHDGWKNLARFYHLPQQPVALEHGLAYQAVVENTIAITDAYSTDGEINNYELILLKDDKLFFPDYQAVSFYSSNLPDKAKQLLRQLEGRITETEMQQLNALALYEKKTHYEIARSFLVESKILPADARTQNSKLITILHKTLEHVTLTILALIASIMVAVPLGITLYRFPQFSRTTLYVTSILQTIPSIALLALMIPFAGIGKFPAVIALFLYALLPILRNTVIGLGAVDPMLKKVASAIGLSAWQKLRWIELPLAMPMVLTGIRTAAVISVGTATLAAFIGAGGLGEFIVTGLALNNTEMILMGAIPAALLAIVTELIFEWIESLTIPRHLQQKLL